MNSAGVTGLFRLGNYPEVRFECLEPLRIFHLGIFVGNGGNDDDIISVLPVHGCSHLVLCRQLHGIEHAKDLITYSSGVAFDGIVACSDVFAMSAVQALSERGRRVPADCAVVGYDDIPFASLTTPPLTTVRQNCRDGAKLLVDNLMRAIAREQPSSTVLPTEVVVRASSRRQRAGSDVIVKPAQTTSRGRIVRRTSS